MIIDDLPSISIANDSDEIAIEQGTATKKITKGNFLQEVTSAISSLISDISGKVSKAGDTISGRLNLDGIVCIRNEADLQVAASYETPPSTNKDRFMWFVDENDKGIGYLRTRIYANTGTVETALTARRVVNGSTVQNNLLLSVGNGGAISVAFSAPAAWRDALGLGEIVYGTNTSGNVSIPSGTATEFSSLTLTAGVWLVVACGDWEANGTGYRQIATSDITNPNRSTATTTVGISASGKETYQQLTLIRQIAGASSTISFYGLQNSGSSLRIYPYVYATRIG